MSERYKILDQKNQYFITFATVGWVDVFSRPEYVDIILESIRFCQLGKELQVYAWCIMTNQVHMIIGTSGKEKMQNIIHDLKKYTAMKIVDAIRNHPGESRKEWLLKP
jgi:REP element-mobilizing transposase RayT